MYHLKSPWLIIFVSFPTKLRQAKYQWELDIPFPTTKYGPPSNDAKCRVQGLKSELNLQSWKQWRVIHVRHVIYLCILWLYYVYMFICLYLFFKINLFCLEILIWFHSFDIKWCVLCAACFQHTTASGGFETGIVGFTHVGMFVSQTSKRIQHVFLLCHWVNWTYILSLFVSN